MFVCLLASMLLRVVLDLWRSTLMVLDLLLLCAGAVLFAAATAAAAAVGGFL